MSGPIIELAEIFWTAFPGQLHLHAAQSLKTVAVQGLQTCIFFVNPRHVGASSISLAPTFFKSQSALIPLLLLSKSNPLPLGFDLVFFNPEKSILTSYSTAKSLEPQRFQAFCPLFDGDIFKVFYPYRSSRIKEFLRYPAPRRRRRSAAGSQGCRQRTHLLPPAPDPAEPPAFQP